MFAVLLPAGMGMVDGRGKAVLLVGDRATDTPPLGAGPLSVTVTVVDAPLTTVGGLIVKLLAVGEAVVKLNTGDQFPYCCGLRA
jgi:hypothetical protein